MAPSYSFGMLKEADMIEQAIAAALAKGLHTACVASAGTTTVRHGRDGLCDYCGAKQRDTITISKGPFYCIEITIRFFLAQ